MDLLAEHFKNGDFNKCKKVCEDKDLDLLFIGCCERGYKDIAEWLITLGKNIDVHVYNGAAFRYACEKGHKDIAEWLINLDNKIDIDIGRTAFNHACAYGRKDVAEWLIKLDGKIAIHAGNETAFRLACRNGHKDLAKWLTIFYDEIPESLKEHKQFIEYYNETRINHWSPETHHLVKMQYPPTAKIIEYLYILYRSNKIFEPLPIEIVFLIFDYLI